MPHDNAAIDATGMYIPIRAHFKHPLEMGLGYLHIQRGVCCSSYFDGLCQMPQVAGRVTIRLPAFLFIILKKSPFGVNGNFIDFECL